MNSDYATMNIYMQQCRRSEILKIGKLAQELLLRISSRTGRSLWGAPRCRRKTLYSFGETCAEYRGEHDHLAPNNHFQAQAQRSPHCCVVFAYNP